MDWMQPRDQLLRSAPLSTASSFKLVDANNRVRELTDPLKRQLRASHSFCQPQASNDGLSAAELEEERQLEQQLQEAEKQAADTSGTLRTVSSFLYFYFWGDHSCLPCTGLY